MPLIINNGKITDHPVPCFISRGPNPARQGRVAVLHLPLTHLSQAGAGPTFFAYLKNRQDVYYIVCNHH